MVEQSKENVANTKISATVGMSPSENRYRKVVDDLIQKYKDTLHQYENSEMQFAINLLSDIERKIDVLHEIIQLVEKGDE